ncbi:hypothetical protein EIN_344430 [Entamoeba invadens IP1]|uniref:N-acetyltransferase domain-containing protein n=1 Tax=Entamoeba invadens IP1 TaxID=370355 RepID=A0A0A1U952_ENTIV|nr:hypothetical protein EIN_344430 [Entamoeba invadens IP1]ELP88503.1 hypothetical protein EIN_344430 [Entamoeba invadens IP1]|eukprot:XP_004255274.1 hypothetical protein EIN_344430 [Entamoeba invadens IP1]
MQWHFKQLEQLTGDELRQIYAIRKDVFCEKGEKDLGHPPMDEVDETCYHSFAWDENGIVCYCRVIEEEPKLFRIARVLVHKNYRKQGKGQQLITHTCEKIHENFGGGVVTLSALEDIHTMYLKVGFELTGERCEFNGIPAVEMVRLV